MTPLIDERDVLRRRSIEHEPLAGRWRGRCGRSAGGEDQAEREGEDGAEGPAAGESVQALSSPAGRNVKGRSAREISVEAIHRVSASNTGSMVDGFSSCCSLKRTEPS